MPATSHCSRQSIQHLHMSSSGTLSGTTESSTPSRSPNKANLPSHPTLLQPATAFSSKLSCSLSPSASFQNWRNATGAPLQSNSRFVHPIPSCPITPPRTNLLGADTAPDTIQALPALEAARRRSPAPSAAAITRPVNEVRGMHEQCASKLSYSALQLTQPTKATSPQVRRLTVLTPPQ